MSKETKIYKTLIFVLFSRYSQALQIFCATNECDTDSKKWCFLLKWMFIKKKRKSVTQTRM
jgi:hypothetical protein